MKTFLLIALFITNCALAQEKSLIESLGAKDTLKIMFSRSNCTNPVNNKARFYFKEGKLVGEQKNNLGVIKEIDAPAKAFLVNFEAEGRAVSDPEKVCTASDGYWFYVNDEFKLLVVDNTCSWFGFDNLVKEVFD